MGMEKGLGMAACGWKSCLSWLMWSENGPCIAASGFEKGPGTAALGWRVCPALLHGDGEWAWCGCPNSSRGSRIGGSSSVCRFWGSFWVILGPWGHPGGALGPRLGPRGPSEPQKEHPRSKKEPRPSPISEPISVVSAFSFRVFLGSPLGSPKIPKLIPK